MKPHRYGICLISRDAALRADVSAVLDRLNHWLGHETPLASQHWPDAHLDSLYRQVAGQAEAYLRQQAGEGAMALELLAFDDLAQAHAALPSACPCDHVLLDTRHLPQQPAHDPLHALLDAQPQARRSPSSAVLLCDPQHLQHWHCYRISEQQTSLVETPCAAFFLLEALRAQGHTHLSDGASSSR